MATKRPKVDLKPIGKLIEAKMKELKVLHDSGKLTNRQMAKVKMGHLPKLKILLFATEKICSEHPWEEHGHDPWFCPPPDPLGEPLGSVAASRRLSKKGRRKK